jgi:hypothetical protein
MTIKIIAKEEIRAQLLKVFSGYCFRERNARFPTICILSPWISDVQLELNEDVFALDDLWFGLDYGIASINLSYALLLLRLDFGAVIEIVTLPPTEDNYGNSAHYHKVLLDFLDEIGCQVYLNTSLHSKLVLSNDSALLGSFNLSKNALYNREEVGVNIDDLEKLKILENYARNVVSSSEPYGFTKKNGGLYGFDKFSANKVTRGMLYDTIVKLYYGSIAIDSGDYASFIRDIMQIEGNYAKYVIQQIASDLEGLYSSALKTYLEPYDAQRPRSLCDKTNQEKLKALNYQGEFDLTAINEFVKTKYARKLIPEIWLKMQRMPKFEGEFTPKWVSDLEK